MNAIPTYLTEHDRWLLWRTKTTIDRKTGEKRPTKVPISYHSGKPADVTKPQSWTDYAKVEAALNRNTGVWDGMGFALGIIEQVAEVAIGLDLDTCLDDEGSPAAWALPFLHAMPSYGEISPSGTGIKVTARIRLTDLPAARRLLDIPDGDTDQARTRTFGERLNGHHAPGAQLFLMRRYFTITGQHWPHLPEDVTLLTLEQIAGLGALFGPREQQAGNGRDGAADDDDTAPDEAALHDKLRVAFLRNPHLRERWKGGTQGLNDTTRSGRDMSVLAMLVAAGFTQGETQAALGLFQHGKVASEPPRYFRQMWERTTATPRSAKRGPSNVLALVTHINTNATWAGALRFNMLTEGYEVCPPFPPQEGTTKGPPRALRDPQDTLTATMYFQANGFPKASKHLAWDALAAVAHQSSYHPVRDYLSGLRWDKTERVGSLFQRYFSAELPDASQQERDHQVAYLEHISAGFMVGAVARVVDPGCKVDHVPVVVGRERLLKSTAIRALCCDPAWFSDDISPNLIERDTKESLSGKWIIELAEIPHIRREVERVKAFFSRCDDRYRSAYGKANQDHPRQCVFIGTSNDLEFVDVTGNRRFWPFQIAGTIDVAAIEADRDQLWAEAMALYRQGVRWWLPPNIEAIAADQQAGFVESDIWDALIAAWIKEHPGPFTMEYLFAKDTGITPYREVSAVSKADEMRAGRCLTKLGWRKSRCTLNSQRAVWWQRK